MDRWTPLNEIVQNIVCLVVVTVWTYVQVESFSHPDLPVPTAINVAFTAVILFLGIKAGKNGK